MKIINCVVYTIYILYMIAHYMWWYFIYFGMYCIFYPDLEQRYIFLTKMTLVFILWLWQYVSAKTGRNNLNTDIYIYIYIYQSKSYLYIINDTEDV